MPLFPQGGGLYPDSISNDLLADMPEGTLKGRALGTGTGNPVDLTAAQAQAIMSGAPWSYRNILGRNGGFEVWQRGAGGSAIFAFTAGVASYACDGWGVSSTNNAGLIGQTAGITAGSRYAMYVQRNSGQTGLGTITIEFALDTDEIVPMRNGIVTLSFTAQAAANFSASGGLLTVGFQTGTGAPARATTTGYTGPVAVINTAAVLTAVATRFTLTSSIVVPANSTQATVYFQYTPTGTAGAADYYIIDDVQLEIGTIATPFERRPFEQELLACKRHYHKSFPYAVAPAQNVDARYDAFNYCQITTAGNGQTCGEWPLPVEMRAAPTITTFNWGAANTNPRNVSILVDCSAIGVVGTQRQVFVYAVNGTGSAVGNQNAVHITADAGI